MTHSSPPLQGIPNIGNTCWLSSLLQLLLSSDLVRDLFQQLPLNEQRHLTQGLKNLPRSVYLIYSMIQQKLIDGGQQDPSEGLLILLEQLHQEHSISITNDRSQIRSKRLQQLLLHTSNTYSPVYNLFQGIIEWIDSDKALRYEPFFILFCDLGIVSKISTVNSGIISVKSMIKEVLCQKKIVRFPPVMMFCVERNSNRVFTADTYELCRDFTIRRADETFVYQLKGICLHSGGMSFGHYTALRIDSSGRWWIADDHNIIPLNDFLETTRQVPRLMLFERL
jgi:ubiquitin C-terminal hydrolase